VVAGTAMAAAVYINNQLWARARTHTHTQNVPQWVGQNFRSMFWKSSESKNYP